MYIPQDILIFLLILIQNKNMKFQSFPFKKNSENFNLRKMFSFESVKMVSFIRVAMIQSVSMFIL